MCVSCRPRGRLPFLTPRLPPVETSGRGKRSYAFCKAMLGAVAAGHPLTAEAGARVLTEGGNAVDACVAAGFASWVAESPLTGPGGGGFMLVHRARDRSTRVLDFFVAVPGLGLEPGAAGAMEAVTVDFSGDSTQVFKIGAASCAVPGAAAGLEAAHQSFGTLPWRELIAPAVELARDGRRADAAAGVPARDPRPDPPPHAGGRAIYGGRQPAGRGRPARDDRPGRDARAARRDGRGRSLHRRARPRRRRPRPRRAAITLEDLSSYRVIRRRPVRAAYRGHELASNPARPPAGS